MRKKERKRAMERGAWRRNRRQKTSRNRMKRGEEREEGGLKERVKEKGRREGGHSPASRRHFCGFQSSYSSEETPPQRLQRTGLCSLERKHYFIQHFQKNSQDILFLFDEWWMAAEWLFSLARNQRIFSRRLNKSSRLFYHRDQISRECFHKQTTHW